MKQLHFFPVYFIFIFLISCKNDQKVDVSHIEIPVEFHGFYKDFSEIDPQNVKRDMSILQDKYPHFTSFYLKELLPWKVDLESPNYAHDISVFLTHKDYSNLLDTVNLFFPNTEKVNKDLLSAFKHIYYYDTSFYIPEHVYYFVSALNFYTAVIIDDQNFGIGLDMFLGEDYPHYSAVGIPEFGRLRFTPENIPVWASQIIYADKYPFETDNQNLLELIIQKGKEYYFLEKVLPDIPTHVIFGYSEEQMNIAEEQEAFIYNYFIQNELLHEKSLQKIIRYVLEGHNTPGFPPELPGNIGSFLGWKIIRQYVEENKLGLKEVLEEKDAQQILSRARYKP